MSAKPSFGLTPEEETAARNLRAAGKSIKEIARTLHRSDKAVSATLKDAGYSTAKPAKLAKPVASGKHGKKACTCGGGKVCKCEAEEKPAKKQAKAKGGKKPCAEAEEVITINVTKTQLIKSAIDQFFDQLEAILGL